jgi:hypothetical protein
MREWGSDFLGYHVQDAVLEQGQSDFNTLSVVPSLLLLQSKCDLSIRHSVIDNLVSKVVATLNQGLHLLLSQAERLLHTNIFIFDCLSFVFYVDSWRLFAISDPRHHGVELSEPVF